MNVARKFIIKGRVQGVGFRFFAIRAARRLGIAGTVRNLPDGSVEAVAQGSAQKIDLFKEQLSKGPPYSVVTSIDEIELPTGHYAGFDAVY